jgi:hypothetical protein
MNFKPVMKTNKSRWSIVGIKFLGITINSTLSWKQHIEDITPRLNNARFAIISIKPFMSVEAMRLIYFSYVLSILSYGIIFWESLYKVNIFLKLKKELLG